MSLSTVEICNMALGNIRANSINSLVEDSLESQACALRYDHARRFVLRDHNWNFAHRVATLSLLEEDPAEWVYFYDQPADALRIKYLLSPSTVGSDRTALYHFEDDTNLASLPAKNIPYQLALTATGTRGILTDLEEARVAYTADIETSTTFDPHFAEALAWYLSAIIAVPIAGAETGADLRKMSLQMYAEIMPAAKAADANEQYFNRSNIESPTITARR